MAWVGEGGRGDWRIFGFLLFRVCRGDLVSVAPLALLACAPALDAVGTALVFHRHGFPCVFNVVGLQASYVVVQPPDLIYQTEVRDGKQDTATPCVVVVSPLGSEL